MRRPVEERRPVEAEGVPGEERISQADVAERVDEDPDEQLNRPDQPGMTDDERRQFKDDEAEKPIGEATRPEDR